MSDIITELFYIVDEHLPDGPYDGSLEQALRDTMSAEQIELFEAYREMDFHREDTERLELFRYILELGLHIP